MAGNKAEMLDRGGESETKYKILTSQTFALNCCQSDNVSQVGKEGNIQMTDKPERCLKRLTLKVMLSTLKGRQEWGEKGTFQDIYIHLSHFQSVFVKTFWDSFQHLFNFLNQYFKSSNSLDNTSP